MGMYTIIIETATHVGNREGGTALQLSDRRTDIIEAKNIDEAWDVGRMKYYVAPTGEGEVQIVDILAGEVMGAGEVQEVQSVQPKKSTTESSGTGSGVDK